MARGQEGLTAVLGATVGDTRPSLVSLRNVADYARHVVAEARSVDARSAIRMKVPLPGLSVDVISFDRDMADAAARNFVRAAAEPETVAPARMQAFVVHPGVDGISPPVPWDRTRFYEPHRLAETLEHAGLQGAYFHDLDHWHIYDMAAGIAVELMRGAGQYPAWETGAPLRPFLHWHYARAGMRLAHCGTLGIGGKGVILAGAGGSGKSGTVIAGLTHGLQSVGDDYVLLDAGDEVRAYPLFATLKQDAAGFRRLRLDRYLDGGSPLNWQGKHQFVIDDMAQCPVPARLGVKALLLPRVGTQPRTEIAPVGRMEAMIALAASSIHQMPGERESGFRFFGKVTRQLPCYRLSLGPDPEEIADSIGSFIAGLPA